MKTIKVCIRKGHSSLTGRFYESGWEVGEEYQTGERCHKLNDAKAKYPGAKWVRSMETGRFNYNRKTPRYDAVIQVDEADESPKMDKAVESPRLTPGPWNVVRSVKYGHLRAGHNYQSDPSKEFTDADIALINAAPDMLLVLYGVRNLLIRLGGSNYDPEYTDVCKVIKKAEAVK